MHAFERALIAWTKGWTSVGASSTEEGRYLRLADFQPARECLKPFHDGTNQPVGREPGQRNSEQERPGAVPRSIRRQFVPFQLYAAPPSPCAWAELQNTGAILATCQESREARSSLLGKPTSGSLVTAGRPSENVTRTATTSSLEAVVPMGTRAARHLRHVQSVEAGSRGYSKPPYGRYSNRTRQRRPQVQLAKPKIRG